MRLQDPVDQKAWNEFARLYEPIIFRMAVRRGLQDADSRDITQQVLCSMARAAERWEPGIERGRFRGWLAKVTTNAVINLLQRDARHRGSGHPSVRDMLEQVPEADPELDELWKRERRLQLFRHAALQIRGRFTDDVWLLFWRTAVDGEAIDQVADELGKSLGAAYAARSRVLAAIRKTVAQIEQSESWN